MEILTVNRLLLMIFIFSVTVNSCLSRAFLSFIFLTCEYKGTRRSTEGYDSFKSQPYSIISQWPDLLEPILFILFISFNFRIFSSTFLREIPISIDIPFRCNKIIFLNQFKYFFLVSKYRP